MFPDSMVSGRDATWKAGVVRNAGTSWDFEDVRDFYVRDRFGCDPIDVRYSDPEWALDLGRAAVAEVMAAVMGEWRRVGSRCAGGIVLAWRDLWPGAGWGIVDSSGRPKAPVYALRRVLDPLAVLIIDEGLSGLRIHVMNDLPAARSARLQLAVYADDGRRVEYADDVIEVAGRGALTRSDTDLLGGFRDLTRAYRFGPPAHDVVVATLVPDDGGPSREAFYLPLGSKRPRLPDVGLTACARRSGIGEWALTIETEHFAQWVSLEVNGFRYSDSWFHMAPNSQRTVVLHSAGPDRPPRGEVRALNSRLAASIRIEAGP
jgi:beta-mannosidase